MLSYCDRNNSKQKMENQLVRSRYKMLILAESLGYVVNFDPYQGAKNGMSTRASERTWGIWKTVILSLLDALPKEKYYRSYLYY